MQEYIDGRIDEATMDVVLMLLENRKRDFRNALWDSVSLTIKEGDIKQLYNDLSELLDVVIECESNDPDERESASGMSEFMKSCIIENMIDIEEGGMTDD